VTPRKRLHNKWQRELSAYWQQNPITYCEVRLKGCFGTYGLAPAHSKKRYDIKTKEEFFQVVAACLSCHRVLDEQMSHEDMQTHVLQIIQQRESQIDCF
jgi:hypothetical protein